MKNTQKTLTTQLDDVRDSLSLHREAILILEEEDKNIRKALYKTVTIDKKDTGATILTNEKGAQIFIGKPNARFREKSVYEMVEGKRGMKKGEKISENDRESIYSWVIWFAQQ